MNIILLSILLLLLLLLSLLLLLLLLLSGDLQVLAIQFVAPGVCLVGGSGLVPSDTDRLLPAAPSLRNLPAHHGPPSYDVDFICREMRNGDRKETTALKLTWHDGIPHAKALSQFVSWT